MRKGTTIEEADCLMNATGTITEHIAARTFENQSFFLSRDGTRVGLVTLLISACPLIMHKTKDGKAILANYNT